MQVGTNRVAEIVASLNKFSRHREAGKKATNLHEGLESTLLIIGHRLKSNGNYPPIQLIKEYGNLPPIDCYPGEINQVFMNLICNAIDAIEERYHNKSCQEMAQKPGIIKIQTEVNEGTAILRITDNGVGINQADTAKIFDAFYTTKPIGKGTGLGLSIAYQIVVNNHHGKLIYNSIPGEGLEFVIELPIR